MPQNFVQPDKKISSYAFHFVKQHLQPQQVHLARKWLLAFRKIKTGGICYSVAFTEPLPQHCNSSVLTLAHPFLFASYRQHMIVLIHNKYASRRRSIFFHHLLNFERSYEAWGPL